MALAKNILFNLSETYDCYFSRLRTWREHHIKEKNFILILALVVGVACGFAALAFKWLIHFI